MSPLTIRLRLPFKANNIGLSSEMTFAGWIPQDKMAIVLPIPMGTLRLSFDIESVQWAAEKRIEELSAYPALGAYHVLVDIVINEPDQGLLTFLQANEGKREVFEGKDAAAFEALADELAALTITAVNRLISFVRSECSQYWLAPLQDDLRRGMNMFVHGRAQYRADGDKWRMCPIAGPLVVIGAVGNADGRTCEPRHWEAAREFLRGSRSPDIVKELLVTAEWLARAGQNRSAITEAVAALEGRIKVFVESPAAQSRFEACMPTRLTPPTLVAIANQFGITDTVRHVLPMLFSEEELPLELLVQCDKAIQIRNNVVHNQQRSVLTAWEDIRAIRRLCGLLEGSSRASS